MYKNGHKFLPQVIAHSHILKLPELLIKVE